MKRRLSIMISLLAVVGFSMPPTVGAVECYSRPGYIAYYPECACTACTGWAISNCTECWDEDGGSCQTTSSNQHCDPQPLHRTE